MNLKLKNKPAETSEAGKKETKKKSVAREWVDAIVFAVIAATIIRWLFLEAFTIPTPSMERSLLVGDFLFVSKIHYGPRTPKTPLQVPLTHQKIWLTDIFVEGGIKSYVDWIQLPMYRLPGLTHIKRNDVVVFNFPPEEQYPVDLKTNYIKRCLGVPGDTFEIRNMQVYVNGQALDNPEEMQFRYFLSTNEAIHDRVFKKYNISDVQAIRDGYKVFTTPATAEELQKLNFVKDVTVWNKPEGDTDERIFPNYKEFPWNEDFYGPLWIPGKDATIPVTRENMIKYGSTIVKYENLDDVELTDDYRLLIDGEAVTEYTFSQNYYFMIGDNRHNSLDSRFWGFVPEDHVVGKAFFIWLSLDPKENLFNKVRWSRLFDLIH